MNIIEYSKRVFNDCLNMNVKSKSFRKMIIWGVIISLVFTPILGIPLGMMIGSIQYQKEINSDNDELEKSKTFKGEF